MTELPAEVNDREHGHAEQMARFAADVPDVRKRVKKATPTISIDRAGLERAFRLMGIGVRWNVRAGLCEIRGNVPQAGTLSGWTAITDRSAAAITEHIRADFETAGKSGEKAPAVFGRNRWSVCLDAILAGCETDPFAEWLGMLEPRPSDLLNSWLSELFDTGETDAGLVRWASRYFFLGAVARTFEPGFKIDEIPVLVGSQGVGKSAVGSAILPDEFREAGHGDALALNVGPKQFAEALQSKIVVEIAEMTGLGRADIDRLKANITRADDGSVRLAYRRNPEPMPRRCVLFGTSNDSQCLPNDSTGNRRFVVVELAGQRARHRVEDWLAEHRDELWRAAVAMYRAGDVPNLPCDLFRVQAEVNDDHRRADLVVEDEIADIPPDRFPDGATLREITLEISSHDAALAQRRMDTGGGETGLARRCEIMAGRCSANTKARFGCSRDPPCPPCPHFL